MLNLPKPYNLYRFVELIIYALLVLAPGTPSGFKGWKREYHSGYIAADEKLYLFFRCNEVNAVRSPKRIRRMPSPMNTPNFPPRPCINDTIADDSESSGEESRKRRDTANSRIRRVPFPMDTPIFPPRPCINDTVANEEDDPED